MIDAKAFSQQLASSYGIDLSSEMLRGIAFAYGYDYVALEQEYHNACKASASTVVKFLMNE